MHLFVPKKIENSKSYFSSVADKLSLKKKPEIEDGVGVRAGDRAGDDIDQKIQGFEPNKNLGTRDLAYELMGFQRPRYDAAAGAIDTKSKLSLHINQLALLKRQIRTPTIFKKIKFGNELTSEELNKEINFQSITIRNKDPRRNTHFDFLDSYEVYGHEQTISLKLKQAKIDEWRKNFKVYFSDDLDFNKKNKIISAKYNGTDQQIHYEGHKMTFMVDSQLYLDSKDQVLSEPLPIKILGFCYPDFMINRESKFWKYDDVRCGLLLNSDLIKTELTELFRINLLAVIAEAQKVGKSLPFFINIAETFLKSLKPSNANIIKRLIAESINDLKKEYSSLIKENISEFIVLGSEEKWGRESINEFNNDADYHTKTHIVDADMLDIAQKLHNERDIICPVPMMGDPSHRVGNKYLEVNFLQTDSDEMLARRTGGLHRAIFEGGVIKQIQESDRKFKTYLRSIDDDPVFKTFSKVQFDSCVIDSQKFFYAKDQFYDEPSRLDRIELSNNEKLKDLPHCFKVNQTSSHKDSSSIDVAPIFSTAVKNAVKGLEFLNEFENPDKSRDSIRDGKILFHIMAFANEKQGVGNKIEDLKKYFNKIYDEIFTDKDKSRKQARIDKIAESAMAFSYKFQQEMKNTHGFETGRIGAKNPNVGARLHRMASQENIMQFFANTKFAEKVKNENSNLEAEFDLAKEQLKNLDSPTRHSPSASPSPSPSPSIDLTRPAGEPVPASLRPAKSATGSTSGFGVRGALRGLMSRVMSLGGGGFGGR
jgi:hypothetical protein